ASAVDWRSRVACARPIRGMTRLTYVALAALAAAPACNEAAASPDTRTPTKVAGHYCHVGALTGAEWKHLEKDLVPQLVAATVGHDELPDGFSFRIHGSFQELGAWLDLVRRCCPSIAYDLALTPELGDATLRIHGASDAKAFIREEFKVLLAA